MLCKDVLEVIEFFYPQNTALDFDNVGLLCGRYDKEVKKVFIALDATDEVIAQACDWGADLLITHHPMFLSPFKAITSDDYIGRRLIKLIQNDISYYAMHTNYDVMKLGFLMGEMLGLVHMKTLYESMSVEESHAIREVAGICTEDTDIYLNDGPLGLGVIGDLPHMLTLEQCCELVKEKYSLSEVKVYGDLEKVVTSVGIAPGSGKRTIPKALEKKVDVLITGDIGHHDGLLGVDNELAIIDAGHYNTEYPFIEDMKNFLQTGGPDLEIRTMDIKTPYTII